MTAAPTAIPAATTAATEEENMEITITKENFEAEVLNS